MREHLFKTERSSDCSSPESALLLTTSCAGVLSQPAERSTTSKSSDTKMAFMPAHAEMERNVGPGLRSFTDNKPEISLGDGVEGANPPAQSEVFSSACENQSGDASQTSKVDISGSICYGTEGEESLPEPPTTSFFSTVSKVSRSAWRSVFGGQVEDVHLEVRSAELKPESSQKSDTAWGEVDPPSHFFSSSSIDIMLAEKDKIEGTETDVDRIETNADSEVCAVSQAEAQEVRDEGEFSGRIDVDRFDPHLSQVCASVASASSGQEGVNSRLESITDFFAPWESSEEESFEGEEEEISAAVDERPAKKPHTDSNTASMLEEDFPPLTHQASGTTPRVTTPPALTQLSLHSIAADILGCPVVEPATDKATRGFEFQDRTGVGERAEGSEANEGGSSVSFKLPKKKSEKAAESDIGAGEVYVSGDDDERGSVPSDWEDRASSAASFGSKENLAELYQEGLTASVSVSERQYCGSLGAGDGLVGSIPVKTQPHMLDDSGDGVPSRLFPPSHKFGSSANRGGRGSDDGSDHRHISHMAEKEPPLERESDFIPFGGLPLSPVSTSQQGATSPGSSMQYERGDLAFMAREKGHKKPKGGRKTKFRPFEERQPTGTVRAEPREKWFPKTMCINCGGEGHVRSNCPKPRQHLLF